MEMVEALLNHAVYSKNRERLLNEAIAESFFQRVLERARPFMSDEHFTVDGTLIEAWARPKASEYARRGIGSVLHLRRFGEPTLSIWGWTPTTKASTR
jgi:transposase-like protein